MFGVDPATEVTATTTPSPCAGAGIASVKTRVRRLKSQQQLHKVSLQGLESLEIGTAEERFGDTELSSGTCCCGLWT